MILRCTVALRQSIGNLEQVGPSAGVVQEKLFQGSTRLRECVKRKSCDRIIWKTQFRPIPAFFLIIFNISS